MSEWTKKILRIFPSAEAPCIVPVPEAAAEMQAIMQNLRTLDRDASIPHFQLVDPTNNLGCGFFNFCNGVLVFNQSVWDSELHTSLGYSGSVHSTYDKIPGEAQAHHIIPKGEPAFDDLRQIMSRFDIHLDDASNGTFLVTASCKGRLRNLGNDWAADLGVDHQRHPYVTPSAYAEALTKDLAEFKLADTTPANREKLKDTLQKIGAQLADGSYAWP